MGKLSKVFIPAFCLLLLAPCILDGKELTIRIWLFQGTWPGGQPGLNQVEIIPLSSSPALAALQSLAGGPENAFKSAVIEALLDMKNLKTLDDLFLFKQSQTENLPFPGKVILGRQIAYRIGLSHKVLSPTLLAFRITVWKTKDGVLRPEKDDRKMLRNAYDAAQDEEKMDRIVEQELTLGYDNPVIVAVPSRVGAYFMVVKLTANEPEPKRRTTPTLKVPPVPNLVPAPQPVSKVFPLYPDELKRRGVKGDVGLRIAINEKGIVQMVQVLSSLNPYLDYTASQSFWQWKFEPVLRGGKPIPAVFEYTFKFDPQIYSAEAMHTLEMPPDVDDAAGAVLQRILAGCAEYCRKLGDTALFYICEETINETNHFLKPPDDLAAARHSYEQVVYEDARGMTGVLVDFPQIMDRRKIERLIYDCDYQLIRRFGDIEERRIVLKENDRRIKDEVKLLEDDRYAVLSPIVSSLTILDKDHQPLFVFRILKEDRIYGKSALILEAVPKFGDADGVRSAKLWVDKERFQVLKCEIEGVPLDGYEDVLSDAVLLNVKPFFLRTYEFRVEKNGVLFPDRTTVRIEYPTIMRDRCETKSKIDLIYKNFKFFMVETEGAIKK